MKPSYAVFVFMIGICLGDDSNTHLNSSKTLLNTNSRNVNTQKDLSVVQSNKVDKPQESDPNRKTIQANITLPTPQHSKATSSPITNTISPSSSSNTKPPTTIAPIITTAPPPIYGAGSWNVTDDKHHVCILLKGEIELDLVNKTDKKIIENYKIPTNAKYHGECSKQFIEFELPMNSSLLLMFDKNSSKFYLHNIKADLTYQIENRTKTETFSNNTLHLFETPLDQSFYCAPSSENEVVDNNSSYLTLKVSHFQFQAFKNSSSSDFDKAVDCEAPSSHTSDVVPIVVGCALALLVVLVLVAYLISRRRFQSRGYHSM